MKIIRALSFVLLALVIEPGVEFVVRFVIAALGVDVLGALSLLAKALL